MTTADEYFAWRDAERRKHRTMTSAEYAVWVRGGGDAISSPSQANAFPGGLTIIIGPEASIIGRTSA